MDAISVALSTSDIPLPWERHAKTAPQETLAPPRHLSARRRVELAFPALVAYRLTDVMIPVGTDESQLCANARLVFNGVALEPLDDLPVREREPIIKRTLALRRWLLDPYAEQRRAGLTVLQAYAMWLDDLRRRKVLHIEEKTPFLLCWDAVAEGILRHPANVAGLDACARSSRKMAEEWRRRLECRGYYLDGGG